MANENKGTYYKKPIRIQSKNKRGKLTRVTKSAIGLILHLKGQRENKGIYFKKPIRIQSKNKRGKLTRVTKSAIGLILHLWGQLEISRPTSETKQNPAIEDNLQNSMKIALRQNIPRP